MPVIERSPLFDRYGPGGLLEDETRLYDLAADPGQATVLQDAAAEARLVGSMQRLMAANHQPSVAFEHLWLAPPCGFR